MDAASLAALVTKIDQSERDGRGLPPVERWNPPDCGPIPMRIASDGTWFYEGTPIGRAPLVRLFSTVLRREADGTYVLVTPIEKLTIEVEDAPFLAVAMEVKGEGHDQTINLRTNVGDKIAVGSDHPLRFDAGDGTAELKPYAHVRGGLEALVGRAVMYDLVELGEEIEKDEAPIFAVRSRGTVFPIMPMAELNRLTR